MTAATGTTWDIVLSAPTRRGADVMGGSGMSPRALYQELLYDRARALDLRTASERAAGGLHPDLRVEMVRPEALVAHLVNSPSALPVVLLSADGTVAAAAARELDALSVARVHYAIGGFQAWRAAGLPLLRVGTGTER